MLYRNVILADEFVVGGQAVKKIMLFLVLDGRDNPIGLDGALIEGERIRVVPAGNGDDNG